MGYDDSELYSAITLAAAEDLNNMSPADVSMILWACGEQGHLCDKFMSGAREGVVHQQVSSIVPAWLQHHPHPQPLTPSDKESLHHDTCVLLDSVGLKQ